MRPDHPERMERARLALMGLSVGDAFGECFFGPAQVLQLARSVRTLPPSPWYYTDDTEMALAVVEVLQHQLQNLCRLGAFGAAAQGRCA